MKRSNLRLLERTRSSFGAGMSSGSSFILFFRSLRLEPALDKRGVLLLTSVEAQLVLALGTWGRGHTELSRGVTQLGKRYGDCLAVVTGRALKRHRQPMHQIPGPAEEIGDQARGIQKNFAEYRKTDHV